MKSIVRNVFSRARLIEFSELGKESSLHTKTVYVWTVMITCQAVPRFPFKNSSQHLKKGIRPWESICNLVSLYDSENYDNHYTQIFILERYLQYLHVHHAGASFVTIQTVRILNICNDRKLDQIFCLNMPDFFSCL